MNTVPLERAWLVLVLAPLWFGVASVGVGTALVTGGADPAQLDAVMTDYVPTVVLVAQVLMAITAVLAGGFRGFRGAITQMRPRAAVLGSVVGVGLAVLYLSVLSPAHEWLQRNLGDYVPAGATTTSLASQTLILFIGNVLLAPVVEEVTYRQLGWLGLSSRHRPVVAAVWTTIMFGLLHWMGGGWYIALTALFAGVPLLLLRTRYGLGAAIACHLALNLVEFGWLVLR